MYSIIVRDAQRAESLSVVFHAVPIRKSTIGRDSQFSESLLVILFLEDGRGSGVDIVRRGFLATMVRED